MRSLVNSIRRIVSRLVSGLLAIGLLLAVVCLGGVAWIYLGSYGYEQIDDAARIASKLAYLERVAQSATTQQRRPNVILILFDDLGYGDLSSYGATAIRTPRIDALAAGGVRLTDYYSPAPVCSPSRAGLLTGRYPIRTRMTQVPIPPPVHGMFAASQNFCSSLHESGAW